MYTQTATNGFADFSRWYPHLSQTVGMRYYSSGGPGYNGGHPKISGCPDTVARDPADDSLTAANAHIA